MTNRPNNLGNLSFEAWMRMQKRQDRKLALSSRRQRREAQSVSQRAVRRTMEEFDETGYA